MGQRLAQAVLLSIPLGGCSLLYNSSDLPVPADAPPDMAPPLEPDNIVLERVSPSILVEGSGAGGSRPVVLVLTGRNFVASNLRIEITPTAGETRAPRFTVDMDKMQVETHGLRIAVPITVEVDPMLHATEAIALDVKVTQDGTVGPVSTAPLTGALTIKGLDELRDTAATTRLFDGGLHEFSEIDITATELRPNDGQSLPIQLRSASSVKIVKPIVVSAKPMPSNMAARCVGGPGGGTGGLGGMGLGGSGEPGTGPSAGLTPGAPGSFDQIDVGLSTLNNPNRGSGGAGGNAAVALGNGGRGGGGGGSIAITAAGNLEVGAISAQGTPGQSGMGLGGADGGGGSGGVILLRAGGTLKAGALNVAGGGNGARGRARFDAGGEVMVSGGDLGANHYRGPMFVTPPLIVRSRTPELTFITKPLTVFRYFVINDDGQPSELFEETTGADGTARATLRHKLERGSNQLCLVVEGASASSDTRNCIQFAYLFEE